MIICPIDRNLYRLREGVYDCSDLCIEIASAPAYCQDSRKEGRHLKYER